MQISPLPPVLPIRLHLQAIDSARNIARRYAIEASADLFGHVIVDLHWGRIGTKGQGRTVSFAQAQDATRFVRQTLNRRASAKKRLGVGYRPVTSATPCPIRARDDRQSTNIA
jgi:predicted DNA-binding WGR domain protein